MSVQMSDIPVPSDLCFSGAPSLPCAEVVDAVVPSASFSSFLGPFAASTPPTTAVAEEDSDFPGFASTSGRLHVEIVALAKRLIAEYGSDLAFYRVYSVSPDHVLFADVELRALFECLIEFRVEFDPCYLLVQGAQRCHTAVVQLALDLSTDASSRVDTNAWSEYLDRALGEAVAAGSVEIAQLLWKRVPGLRMEYLLPGPDPAEVLYRAACKGHDAMTHWLLTVPCINGRPRY